VEVFCLRILENRQYRIQTTEEVLAAVGKERCFVQAIVKRKKNWIEPCCAREQFVKACVRGKNSGEETKREARDGHD